MEYPSAKEYTSETRVSELGEEVLEDILLEVEEKVSEYLSSKLPRRSNFNTIVSIELRDGQANLVLDLEASGPFGDVYNYEQILQDAINYARRVFEELVEKRSQQTT